MTVGLRSRAAQGWATVRGTFSSPAPRGSGPLHTSLLGSLHWFCEKEDFALIFHYESQTETFTSVRTSEGIVLFQKTLTPREAAVFERPRVLALGQRTDLESYSWSFHLCDLGKAISLSGDTLPSYNIMRTLPPSARKRKWDDVNEIALEIM